MKNRILSVIRLASLFTILMVAGCSPGATSQDDTDTDAVIARWLEEGAAIFGEVNELTVLIEFYGQKQFGITYVGGLLDAPPVETLVVTLEGSDCVIYVETSFALAMTTLQGSTDPGQFRENLKLLRYRDGRIQGYHSRLHYFSDWMKTNQEKGLIEILHQDADLPAVNRVGFMTANRESYPRLVESDSLFRLIAVREKELQEYQLHYIPQDRIREFEKNWQTGDLLGFVSTIEGLDIAHTALIHRDGDRVGFYHASTVGEVLPDPKTVFEYTRDRRNVRGVVVARPVFGSEYENR
jgi:hypothetical protein